MTYEPFDKILSGESRGEIVCGDCLEIMPQLPDKCFDMILCDLPYGTTVCKWDMIIPFDPLWKQYKRVIKDDGAIVLTASQPFTTMLIASNMKMFKYCWVWEKSHPTGFALSKKRPLKYHEDIIIFYSKQPVYNPQMWVGKPSHSMGRIVNNGYIESDSQLHIRAVQSQQSNLKYPKSIQKFNNPRTKNMHPTQKPVKLFEYLIKTYTNEDDIVLDNCIGSGTTAMAAIKTNRGFFGCDISKEYVKMALGRIEKERVRHPLF